MPYAYSINLRSNLIVIRGIEHITDNETTEIIEAIKSDPKFKPSQNQFIDLTMVIKFELSIDYIGKLAKNPLLEATSKTVIIAPSEISFGTARSFMSLSGDAAENILICRSYAEAEGFLNLSGLLDFPKD